MDRETLKSIKPRIIKISDKYSTNLYKFLKSKGCFKVYFDTWDTYKERQVEINWNDLNIGRIYLGSNIMDDTYEIEGTEYNMGCLLGKDLSSILNGRRLTELGAYCGFGGFYPKKYFADITEEFWRRYVEVGRCLFYEHGSWLQGNEKQFTYSEDGNTRTCNWCGRVEHKIKRTKVEEVEIWE